MSDPLATISTRTTLQTEQADPRQQRNHAGGYTFTIDPMAQLRRFLVLGTTSGTYYQGERELTRENADMVLELARTRGEDVVAEVLAISVAGRAPKQNPGLFALAAVMGLGDRDAKWAAQLALPKVARTGSTLFTFVKYVEQFRGWGRGLRSAVQNWYLGQHPDALAYQVAKYRSRDDWSHRDVLRLAHPKPVGEVEDRAAQAAIFDFACGRDDDAYDEHRPRILDAFRAAQSAETPAVTARMVRERPGLSWEMLRSEHLTDPEVWSALLVNGLPQTALMRNLPRLTRLGLLAPGSQWTRLVADQLADADRLRKARVHPVNVLIALRTYASGQSLRGEGTWAPVPQVTNALDAAFYAAFGAVEPAGKRTLVAVDVSGSMGSMVGGLPISCREAAAAIGMVTMATEPDAQAVGFTSNGRSMWDYRGGNTALTPLDLSPRRRLDDVVRSISNLPFGGTDCALPWTEALAQGLEVDTVIVLTDSESWAGPIHTHQAVRQYRERTGIAARNIVVGMTATRWTVNDPADPLGLDVAGFDASVPTLISDFSRGDF
jgi:60 kDa SS-A/Ro ribonucleoprotein